MRLSKNSLDTPIALAPFVREGAFIERTETMEKIDIERQCRITLQYILAYIGADMDKFADNAELLRDLEILVKKCTED